MPDNTAGLNTAVDLIAGQIVDGMDVEKLSKEQLRTFVDARTLSRTRSIDLIMGQLSLPTKSRGDLFGQHSHQGQWPKATEQDRGRRQRIAGLGAAGFPIYKFGPIRSGWTFDMLAKITNTELLIQLDDIMAGHLTTNYNEALRALFRNTNYVWSHDLFKEDGQVTVKPLVNGDGFIPPEHNGTIFDGTHDHYLTGGALPIDQPDLVNAADELRHHGYGQSPTVGGQGGRIITWVHPDQRDDCEGHADFIGANDPFVQDVNKIFVALDQDQYFGYNKKARTLLREVPWMPAGYTLTFVANDIGERPTNGFAPLRRRTPVQANLVGIRRFEETTYPLQESWWQDFFGFGVANRLTAVITHFTAGPYTIPDIAG